MEQRRTTAIQDAQLRENLRAHIGENIDYIYKLKYLHAFGFFQMSQGNWESSLDRINLLENLGALVNFTGKQEIVYCTVYNFIEEKSSSSRTNITSEIFGIVRELTFLDWFVGYKDFSAGVLNDDRESFSVSKTIPARTDKDCEYKSKAITESPYDTINVYRHSLTYIDKAIEKLRKPAYAVALFSLNRRQQGGEESILGFGNVYHTMNKGEHPFTQELTPNHEEEE